MQSTAQNGARVAKVVETEQDAARLHKHLKEVIEGEAFKGSQRSGQFLTYIVEESIAGRFTALKERVIGVKLFGRDPSYDTGEDAIVRVTASDVRRRLLQHYGKYGFTSEFRINLPLGSYIPEITREPSKTTSVRTPWPPSFRLRLLCRSRLRVRQGPAKLRSRKLAVEKDGCFLLS